MMKGPRAYMANIPPAHRFRSQSDSSRIARSRRWAMLYSAAAIIASRCSPQTGAWAMTQTE